MIRKILCLLGFHTYNRSKMTFLRNNGNVSIYRCDKTCVYCGKSKCELYEFPAV